jgi:hypothetical protein
MDGVAIPVTGIRTDRVRIAPLPAWVDQQAYAAPERPPEAFINGGLCTLLNDTQVDLCGPTRAWHMRSAERVVSTAGAERAAQFSVSFNPAFEDLHIHSICVIRDGVAFEHAKPENFEIFRRERRLERLMLDGRLSVTLITPDVRVGDLIETAYTIYGLNPALGGLHTAWIGFAWSAPILDTRHRLRHPATRPMAVKGFCNPPAEEKTEVDGVVDRRWRASERIATEPVDLVPPWMITQAEIQFSEARNWSQVAALFGPLYEERDPLPEALSAEIDALAAAHATLAARATAALRFVQSQIRYLAVSIGEGGFQPRDIATIWATRYGDCKDVSRLLTAIAQRMGLEACPALVNTQVGEGLAGTLPSPTAFNHCIVKMTIGDQIVWMDATMRPQGGTLANLHQPYFGFALPLTGTESMLEPMPAPKMEHIVDVSEEVVLSKSVSEPALYRWRTVWRGWKADGLRDELRNEGEAAVVKRYLRQIRDTWPHAEIAEPTRFEDDPHANTITVSEAYRLPAAWRARDGAAIEFSTKDYFINGDLARLEFPTRQEPIHLGRPRLLTRTVTLIAPFMKKPSSWSRRTDTEHLSFLSLLETQKRTRFVLTQRLEVRADQTGGSHANAYGRITDHMAHSDLVLSMVARGDKVAAPGEGGLGDLWQVVMILIGGLFLMGLVGAALRSLEGVG